MRHTRFMVALAALAVTLAGCASAPYRFVTLGDSLEPVRNEFNAQKSRPRVVALFSPT